MEDQYQIDIFGYMHPVDDPEFKEKKGFRETIKGRYRKMYGYDDSHRCGECKYCFKSYSGKSGFYKCELIGNSGSEATDIRLKDIACTRFREKEVHS